MNGVEKVGIVSDSLSSFNFISLSSVRRIEINE